jgi:hypothetical protein
MKPMLNQFLTGAIFAFFAVLALMFARYWRKTRDRLFILFAVAFGTLAFERATLALVSPDYEFVPYIYLVRLMAFGLIMIAIVDKNRPS